MKLTKTKIETVANVDVYCGDVQLTLDKQFVRHDVQQNPYILLDAKQCTQLAKILKIQRDRKSVRK